MPNNETLEELQNELIGATIEDGGSEHEIVAIRGVAFNAFEDTMMPETEGGETLALQNATNYGIKFDDTPVGVDDSESEFVTLETLQENLQEGVWVM